MIVKIGQQAKRVLQAYKEIASGFPDATIYDYETDDGAICLIRKTDRACLYINHVYGRFVVIQGTPDELETMADTVGIIRKADLEDLSKCAQGRL